MGPIKGSMAIAAPPAPGGPSPPPVLKAAATSPPPPPPPGGSPNMAATCSAKAFGSRAGPAPGPGPAPVRLRHADPHLLPGGGPDADPHQYLKRRKDDDRRYGRRG